MLDFDKLPRFQKFKFQIVTRIPDWAHAYECSEAAVERQIDIAHAWCDANKRRAPRTDPMRFLFNWLRKAREYGNLSDRRLNAYKEARPQEEEVMTGEDWRAIRQSISPRKVKGIEVKEAIQGEEIK